jgi:hypothetical protein
MTAGGGIESCSRNVVAASSFGESSDNARGFGLVVFGLVSVNVFGLQRSEDEPR